MKQGTGGCDLKSRSGQLVPFDPFSNPIGNFSMCLMGKSEIERNRLLQNLIVGYLGVGGRAWVITQRPSYKMFCEEVGGQCISMRKVVNDLGLNPFGLMLEGMPTDDYWGYWMGGALLEAMASPIKPLNEFQSRELERAFIRVWEGEGRKGTPALVAKLLKESSVPQIHEIATLLHPFTHGEYSQIFERTIPLEFDNPFVLLDMDGFSDVPEFCTVLLMRFMSALHRELWMNDEILLYPKMIVFPEIIDFMNESLNNENLGNFLSRFLRSIRMRSCGTFLSADHLRCFYTSMAPYGEDLISNSDFSALFSHDSLMVDWMDGEMKSGHHYEHVAFSPFDGETVDTLNQSWQGNEGAELYLRSPKLDGIGWQRGVFRVVDALKSGS